MRVMTKMIRRKALLLGRRGRERGWDLQTLVVVMGLQ
jgi:hypothetical protein